MSPLLKIVLPLLLALAACSDSNDDDDDPVEDPVDDGTYVIGGGGCGSESSVSLTTVDGDPSTGNDTVNEPVETEDFTTDELVVCANDPTELASTGLLPTGSGSLTFDGREYELGSAIRVASGDAEDASNELLLHDGETRVSRSAATSDDGLSSSSGYAYGVYDAAVVLSFTLLPDAAEGDLSGRLYEVVPGDDDADERTPSDTALAIDPIFVVDLDGDGTISIGELFEVASGQLIWSGTEEAPSLNFNLVLEDGRPVEGSYEGGYELIE